MAALTKDRNTRTKNPSAARHGRRGVAANAVIYYGALIAKNAAGYLVAATDAAARVIVGISEEKVDATGAADGAKLCSYVTGVEVELNNAGGAIVQANLGRGCYVADDNSVTTRGVSVNKVFVGVVQEFTAALVWAFIDESHLGVLGDEQVGNIVAAAGAPALGIPLLARFEIPDAASADYDIIVPDKIEVIDATTQKTVGAAGANANTVQVKNGANAISDAMSINNAAQGAIVRAASITDAQSTIAAGGTLRVSVVKAGGSAAVRESVLYIKRT